MATVAITLRTTTPSRMAPSPVYVDVVQASTGWDGVSQPKWCRATIEWDFGSGEDGVWLIDDPRPGKTGQKDMATDQRGFNAAFIYTTSGSKTITVNVTDEDGTTYQDTENVTINADTRTIRYVDATGGDDGNGGTDGTTDAWQTIGYALTQISNDYRLRLKRGETFNFSSAWKPTFTNLIVEPYGSGADPVVNYNGAPNSGTSLFGCIGQNSITQGINLTTTTIDAGTDAVPADEGDGLAGGVNVAYVDCTVTSAEGGNGFYEGHLIRSGSDGILSIRNTFEWLGSYLSFLQTDDSVFAGLSATGGNGSHFFRLLTSPNARVNWQWCHLDHLSPGSSKAHIRLQEADYISAYQNYFANEHCALGFDENKTSNVLWDSNFCKENAVQLGSAIVVSTGVINVCIRNNILQTAGSGRGILLEGSRDYEATNPYRGEVDGCYAYNNTLIFGDTAHKHGYIQNLDPGWQQETVSSVDTGTDTITISTPYNSNLYKGNGSWIYNNRKIRFYGSDLPSPLTEGTIYYIISASAPSFKVSTSEGGGAVDLTTTGTSSAVLPFVYTDCEYKNNLTGGATDITERMITIHRESIVSANNCYYGGSIIFQHQRDSNLTLAQWNALSFVSNEVQESVPLAALTAPNYLPDPETYTTTATAGSFLNAAKYDYHGNTRPAGSIVAGAVQNIEQGGVGSKLALILS